MLLLPLYYHNTTTSHSFNSNPIAVIIHINLYKFYSQCIVLYYILLFLILLIQVIGLTFKFKDRRHINLIKSFNIKIKVLKLSIPGDFTFLVRYTAIVMFNLNFSKAELVPLPPLPRLSLGAAIIIIFQGPYDATLIHVVFQSVCFHTICYQAFSRQGLKERGIERGSAQ